MKQYRIECGRIVSIILLLIGMDADSETELQYLKDSIDTIIPSSFSLTKVYDSHGGNHRSNVITALNTGQHLVNHADHGSWDYLGTGDRNHGSGDVFQKTRSLGTAGGGPSDLGAGREYHDLLLPYPLRSLGLRPVGPGGL